MSPLPRWTDVRAVVLDVDGTLIDSADGIVAGFRHALESVGVASPGDAALRADLGPPLVSLLPALGVPAERLPDALDAYRTFYLADGLRQATPYEGIVDVLGTLAGRFALGTATAKRTDVALAILEAHELAHFFEVVNGLDDDHPTKAETLTRTLELMGGLDPATTVMVGDRHSDVAAGRAVGARTVGVLWGYGSRSELEAAHADVLLDHPSELADLLLR